MQRCVAASDNKGVRFASYNLRNAAVMEPVYMMASKAIVLRDMWVRIPPAALTRGLRDRKLVLFLAGEDLSASQIARTARIPRSTVRDWLGPRPPRPKQELVLDPRSLPAAHYSYLLGFYLGDGWISRGKRDVFRLRIRTDSRYPGLIAECAEAMAALMPKNKVLIQKMPYNAVEIGCSSKMWAPSVPAAWSRPQARAQNRARPLAARDRRPFPARVSARLDPLGRLPGPQPGERQGLSALLLHAGLRRHPRPLLRSL